MKWVNLENFIWKWYFKKKKLIFFSNVILKKSLKSKNVIQYLVRAVTDTYGCFNSTIHRCVQTQNNNKLLMVEISDPYRRMVSHNDIVTQQTETSNSRTTFFLIRRLLYVIKQFTQLMHLN